MGQLKVERENPLLPSCSAQSKRRKESLPEREKNKTRSLDTAKKFLLVCFRQVISLVDFALLGKKWAGRAVFVFRFAPDERTCRNLERPSLLCLLLLLLLFLLLLPLCCGDLHRSAACCCCCLCISISESAANTVMEMAAARARSC